MNTSTGVSAAPVALRLLLCLLCLLRLLCLRSWSAGRYACGCSASVRGSCVRRNRLCLGTAATACGTSCPTFFVHRQPAHTAVSMAAAAPCAEAQLPSSSRSHCVPVGYPRPCVRGGLTPPRDAVQWPKCDFFSGNESHTILGIMAGEWTRKFGPANFDLILEVRRRLRSSVDELASLVSSAYQSC